MAYQSTDTVYVIVADSGGGDDLNPHATLEKALARIGPDETGVEVWEVQYADWQNPADSGRRIWERW